jgi:hypothetical protein
MQKAICSSAYGLLSGISTQSPRPRQRHFNSALDVLFCQHILHSIAVGCGCGTD